MKILVVEDEEKVSRFLKKGFEEHGLCADVAADGRDGYFLADSETYDCLILDILLPKLNGMKSSSA